MLAESRADMRGGWKESDKNTSMEKTGAELRLAVTNNQVFLHQEGNCED